MAHNPNKWDEIVIPRPILLEAGWVMHFVFRPTGRPVFRDKFFEFAGHYENGYAPVGVEEHITHIDRHGKIAHNYLFADAGKVDPYGVVRVKLHADSTWRQFHIHQGEFID